MQNLILGENRLKKLIISDKKENPIKIERVLKSEILNVLNNYFDINSDNLRIDICVDENGLYRIVIDCESNNFKFANCF